MTPVRFLLTVVLGLLLLPAASAQEGRVLYTVTTEIEVELPPEVAHLQDQVPSQARSERLLLFTEAEALTMNPPSEDDRVPDPSAMTDGGNPVVVRMLGADSDDQTYVDLGTGEVIERRDVLGRTFRIVGEVRPLAWRLTGEQSTFLGYTCQRAVAERDSTRYEAWFTSEIPVAAGPEQFGGLPGLILVLTAGDRTFEATSVDLSPLEAGVVQKPTGGREVTSQELAAIVEERIEDMNTSTMTTDPDGSSRSFRIIRRSN